MQNTPMKFSPITKEKSPYVGGPYFAHFFRSHHPGKWFRDPWTGEMRSDVEIEKDPFGMEIIPSDELAEMIEAFKNAQPGKLQMMSAEELSGIDATLDERGSRYGTFGERARIAQNIKRAMADSPNWPVLSDDKKETLEMLANKISRILNGDPEYHDSWHDIIGYTKLVADTLQP